MISQHTLTDLGFNLATFRGKFCYVRRVGSLAVLALDDKRGNPTPVVVVADLDAAPTYGTHEPEHVEESARIVADLVKLGGVRRYLSGGCDRFGHARTFDGTGCISCGISEAKMHGEVA